MSKYVCKECKYETNYKSQWNNHINTTLHKTGKRKTRSDRKCPLKCPHCDHKINNNTNMRLHMLNHHSTPDERRKGFTYYCEYCDFGTFGESNYNKHANTRRHKRFVELLNKNNNK